MSQSRCADADSAVTQQQNNVIYHVGTYATDKEWRRRQREGQAYGVRQANSGSGMFAASVTRQADDDDSAQAVYRRRWKDRQDEVEQANTSSPGMLMLRCRRYLIRRSAISMPLACCRHHTSPYTVISRQQSYAIRHGRYSRCRFSLMRHGYIPHITACYLKIRRCRYAFAFFTWSQERLLRRRCHCCRC